MIGFLFDVRPPMAPVTALGKLAKSWHEVEGNSRLIISMLFKGPDASLPTPTSSFVYPIKYFYYFPGNKDKKLAFNKT